MCLMWGWENDYSRKGSEGWIRMVEGNNISVVNCGVIMKKIVDVNEIFNGGMLNVEIVY